MQEIMRKRQAAKTRSKLVERKYAQLLQDPKLTPKEREKLLADQQKETAEYDSIVLISDGGDGQVDYDYDPLTRKPTEALEKWTRDGHKKFKLGAAESITKQACDQAGTFPGFHTAFRPENRKKLTIVRDPRI